MSEGAVDAFFAGYRLSQSVNEGGNRRRPVPTDHS
jgi:hypothetical protein